MLGWGLGGAGVAGVYFNPFTVASPESEPRSLPRASKLPNLSIDNVQTSLELSRIFFDSEKYREATK